LRYGKLGSAFLTSEPTPLETLTMRAAGASRRVEGDLLDADSLQQAVEGVSAIVHLAAVFRTPDQDAIWRANLNGTRNLIAAAKAHAPEARFVMASTGLVYDEDPCVQVWKTMRSIRSSRILQAKLPPRTNSEAADSPGASSGSRLLDPDERASRHLKRAKRSLR
jgi:nucleoside-diphosphate-sugar epimerase